MLAGGVGAPGPVIGGTSCRACPRRREAGLATRIELILTARPGPRQAACALVGFRRERTAESAEARTWPERGAARSSPLRVQRKRPRRSGGRLSGARCIFGGWPGTRPKPERMADLLQPRLDLHLAPSHRRQQPGVDVDGRTEVRMLVAGL